MPRPVGFVAHGMFPKAPLPQAIFAFSVTRQRHTAPDPFMRKPRLDRQPAPGIIRIAVRQSPQRMQMFRQHHQRNDLDRPRRPHPPQHGAQNINVIGQHPRPPIHQRHRKEISPSRHPIPPVMPPPPPRRSVYPTPLTAIFRSPDVNPGPRGGLIRRSPDFISFHPGYARRIIRSISLSSHCRCLVNAFPDGWPRPPQSSSNIKIGTILLFPGVGVTGIGTEATLVNPPPLVAVSEH